MGNAFKAVIQTNLILLALSVASFNADARNCVRGKQCGNSCISKNDICHKEEGAFAHQSVSRSNEPAPASRAPQNAIAEEPTSRALGHKKQCSKGKACGSSCIPKDAVCHQ